jgi:dipeptidyl aminopeptidase/acylaminoacyl peptidase
MQKLTFFTILYFVAFLSSDAQTDLKFQTPPKEILELVDVQPAPSVMLDSKAKWLVLSYRDAFLSLEELAETEEKLAGMRINPELHCRSRVNYLKKLTVQSMVDGKELTLTGLPEKLKFTSLQFSPDEKYLSFVNASDKGLEIYLIDLATGKVTSPYAGHYLNAIFGSGYSWSSDGTYLILSVCVSPNNKAPKFVRKVLPTGPAIQESSGKKAPVVTYQDLLKNKNDEDRFDELVTSTYVKLTLDGNFSSLLPMGIYLGVNQSPDGKYFLVSELKKPYSYIVPFQRFPTTERLIDEKGNAVMTVNETPLIESLPTGFDAVQIGKREMEWRNDEPATLYWVEAQDAGDPNMEADYRDAVYEWKAPFDGEKRLLVKTQNRFNYIIWGDKNLAIVYDNWWKNRNTKVYLIDPEKPKTDADILFDYSTQDYYNHPGSFITDKNAMLQNVLLFSKDKKKMYMTGEGYSPEGNKPFYAEFDLKTKTKKMLWQADGKSTYERFIKLIDPVKKTFLTSIETNDEMPNVYLRTAGSKAKPIQKTFLQNPFKKFSVVKKEKIKYKRADGIDLDAMMYLPAGFDKTKGEKLPLIIWAYPTEFKDNKAAGQIKDSPHKFTRPSYGSPLYWAMKGYAVLDNASFPIIGEGDSEPNDTFIPQLVANGQAAIDKMVNDGIVDPKRVAVGGHSYGAFMTANLMAHCDLFACGIARSGAYNRSLTPFGFQQEERLFWEAKDLYMEMSPFYWAEKINEPLLMIHGDADNNPGTFTLQSERLFAAIKGLGGTARLVLLPHESHGYAAKENVLHMLWEQDEWLKKYCPNNEQKTTGSVIVNDDKLVDGYAHAMETGQKLFSVGKYGEARTSYQEALNLKKGDEAAIQKISECDKILVTDMKYQESIASGDREFAAAEYNKALHYYNGALSYKENDPILIAKIADCERKKAEAEAIKNEQDKINAEYKSSIAAGDMAFGKKDYDVARKYYSQASALKPDEKYPKDKMAEAEKLKAEQE